MTQFASPVLHTLLDTDAYKLHMQQAVFHHYYDVHVAAEFRCRGDDLLGIYADAIREQVDAMQHLTLQDEEYQWLSGLPFFKADYLNWLRDFRYKPEQVTVLNDNGKLDIRLEGPWREVIMWEVPLLAVISELAHRYRSPETGVEQAVAALENKLAAFSTLTEGLDMSRFRLMDFGTRRRFSRDVQEAIVKSLQQEPWFVGTSNYDLARRLSLTPMGTQAHEWFQAHQQISPDLANSQRAALAAWLEEYPNQLGIALTDCITMDAFLRDFGPEFAERYQGLRHDSGDPVEWGEKAIAQTIIHPIKQQEPGHFAFYQMSATRMVQDEVLAPWQKFLAQQLRSRTFTLVGVDYVKKYQADMGGVLVGLGMDQELEVYAKEIGRLEARLLWANKKGMEFPPYFLKALRESVELYQGQGNFARPS